MGLIDPVPPGPLAGFLRQLRQALLPVTIATDAVDGFALIPTMAGAPTGIPNIPSGSAAVVYDTTNSKLWVFDPNTGTWRFEILT